MKKTKSKTLQLLTWSAFLVYLLVLINLTIFERHSYAEISWWQKIASINFTPFKTIFYYLRGNQNINVAIVNLLGNILAFIPMGFLLPILFGRYKKIRNVFYISFIVSLSIEMIQLIFRLGSCDIDDIILNILGGLVGFSFYMFLNYRVRAKHENTN